MSKSWEWYSFWNQVWWIHPSMTAGRLEAKRTHQVSLCSSRRDCNQVTRDNANEQQKTERHCYPSKFPCLRRRFWATVWLYALAETKPRFSLPASVYIAISVAERQVLRRRRFPLASFVYSALERRNSPNDGLEGNPSLLRFFLLARIWSFACLRLVILLYLERSNMICLHYLDFHPYV